MTTPPVTPSQSVDLVAGLALAGLRAGAGAVRILAVPARAAAAAPVVGPPLRRRVARLEADGREAIVRGRAQAEALAARVLAAPEVERTMDRTLEGPLTEALARSLGKHRVAERLAGELVVAGAIEEAMTSALEHEAAQRLLLSVLESPGLERLIGAALESRIIPEVTDRLLNSEEMKTILEYVATSPEVRRVFHEQSTSLAGEMVDDVRGRSERLDGVAEATVRGWLRRPRPSTG
jgi:hypothetical protein